MIDLEEDFDEQYEAIKAMGRLVLILAGSTAAGLVLLGVVIARAVF